VSGLIVCSHGPVDLRLSRAVSPVARLWLKWARQPVYVLCYGLFPIPVAGAAYHSAIAPSPFLMTFSFVIWTIVLMHSWFQIARVHRNVTHHPDWLPWTPSEVRGLIFDRKVNLSLAFGMALLGALALVVLGLSLWLIYMLLTMHGPVGPKRASLRQRLKNPTPTRGWSAPTWNP